MCLEIDRCSFLPAAFIPEIISPQICRGYCVQLVIFVTMPTERILLLAVQGLSTKKHIFNVKSLLRIVLYVKKKGVD